MYHFYENVIKCQIIGNHIEHKNCLTARVIEDYFRFLLARNEKVNLLFVLLTDFGSMTQKKVIHLSIFQIQLILEYWSISI